MVNNDFVVSQVSSDQMADEAVVVPVKKVVFDVLLLQLGKHVAFFSCSGKSLLLPFTVLLRNLLPLPGCGLSKPLKTIMFRLI